MIKNNNSIQWDGLNMVAHGTIILTNNLLNLLDGNATIFSDLKDKDSGVPAVIDELIKAEREEDRWNAEKRIKLLEAVKGMFE
jgi:hypothetical protein